MLQIGFIHVTNENDVNWWPPLAFGSLKAYLSKYLGDDLFTMDRFLQSKDLYKHDIVAISSTTQDFNQSKRIAYEVKEKNPKAVVVVGGSHITWLPKTMNQAPFDFGVIGEGEQTFLEFVRYVMNGKKEEDLFKINGLVFNYGEGLIAAPPRAMIEPLDNIPFPFREPAHTPHLFTSRGCPYKCKFCSSSAFWKTTRFHSADYVVDEIEMLIGMNASHIPIQDDLFIVDKRRFIDIIEKLKHRGLDKKFTCSIAVRANLITDELCAILKDARPPIISVAFGAESASDRILKLMGKGYPASKNQDALDKLHEIGMPVGCSLVVGYPSETEDEIRATCDFVSENAKEGKLDPGAAINILTPFPGTVVWDEAVEAGIIDLNTFDWDRLGVFASHTASHAGSFDEWVNIRRRNNSVYLNEDVVPQERLYEILREHEIKMKEVKDVRK